MNQDPDHSFAADPAVVRAPLPPAANANAQGIRPAVYHSKYDVCVVCGGGVKTVSLLGVIQYLCELDCLSRVETFAGTSAGSIICLMLAVGMRPIDILKHLTKFDIHKLCDTSVFSAVTSSLFSKYGLFSTALLRDNVRSVLAESGVRADLTLGQLKSEYGKELVVVTFNVSRSQCDYLSYKTHPDLECATAVCMSSCVPLYFVPVDHEGQLYVDGGIFDNFPIRHAVSMYPHKRCIGFYSKADTERPFENIVDYLCYITNVLSGGLRHDYRREFAANPLVHVVQVKAPHAIIPLSGVGDIVHYTNVFIQGYNLAKSNKPKLE